MSQNLLHLEIAFPSSLGSFPSPWTVYPDFDSCYSHFMSHRMTPSVRHMQGYRSSLLLLLLAVRKHKQYLYLCIEYCQNKQMNEQTIWKESFEKIKAGITEINRQEKREWMKDSMAVHSNIWNDGWKWIDFANVLVKEEDRSDCIKAYCEIKGSEIELLLKLQDLERR